MMDEGLPISEERLEELAEGLSPEAKEILNRWLMAAGRHEELGLTPEQLMEGFEELPQEERGQLVHINRELKIGYERRLREDEAYIDLGARAQELYERAADLDDTITESSTIGDAVRVLEAHGEPIPISEEERNTLIEVEPPLEEMDWIAVPESEVPADENGVPTKQAAKYGMGFAGGEGEIIKLYPKQVDAMRLMAREYPYREFIEDHLEEIPAMQESFRAIAFEEAPEIAERLGEERITEITKGWTTKTLMQSYHHGLAKSVTDYPHGPAGIVDHYKNKNTRAARRYKKWREETTLKAIVKDVEEQLIAEGVFEVVVIDGVEYLKHGPNYEEFRRKMDASEADEE